MGVADVAGILRWGWRGWTLVIGLALFAILAVSWVRLDGLPDLIVNKCYRQDHAQNEQCPAHVVAWIALGMLWDFFYINRVAVNALATAMIAIFTGTLFWSNIRLWRASDKSAEAAEQAIAESRKIGQAQVRAYLSCEAFSAEVDSEWVWFYPIIKNSGQSPAETTRFSAYIDVSVPGSGHRNKSRESEGEGPYIAAGETGKMYVGWHKGEFPEAAFKELRSSNASFEVFCRLYCTDVFGVERKTTFLVSVGKTLGAMNSDKVSYEQGIIDHLTPGVYDD